MHDATEALREDRAPAWDPEGKYLYFISARDFNPIYDALQFDLSFPHAMRPYVVTLRRDVPNPFVAVPAPLHHSKHDDEDDDDEDADDEATPKRRRRRRRIAIDTEGLAHRILAFPVEEGSYSRVAGVKGRAIFSRFPVHGIRSTTRRDEDEDGGTLVAYDFRAERSATLATDVDGFVLGNDARTLVYESHGKLRAIDAGGELPEDDPEAKPPSETDTPQRLARPEPHRRARGTARTNGRRCCAKPGDCSANSSGIRRCRGSIGPRCCRATKRSCRASARAPNSPT